MAVNLMVDDADINDVLHRVLISTGFMMCTAADGGQARATTGTDSATAEIPVAMLSG